MGVTHSAASYMGVLHNDNYYYANKAAHQHRNTEKNMEKSKNTTNMQPLML